VVFARSLPMTPWQQFLPGNRRELEDGFESYKWFQLEDNDGSTVMVHWSHSVETVGTENSLCEVKVTMSECEWVNLNQKKS
jgi:hypothetical protein